MKAASLLSLAFYVSSAAAGPAIPRAVANVFNPFWRPSQSGSSSSSPSEPAEEQAFARRCGPTKQWTDENLMNVEKHFASRMSFSNKNLKGYMSKAIATNSSDRRIDIYWHVIYANMTTEGGYLPDTKIQESIDVLNDGYKNTGIEFELLGVTKTHSADWFLQVGPEEPELAYADAMKKALRQGGPETLNIYTVGFQTGSGEGLLGYATFPMDYEGAPQDDGVVIAYNSVPGGSARKFDEGKTLTHEVGHWLGLFHVFSDQGTCQAVSDFVEDTPDQRTATSGCPKVAPDSCPGAVGGDSIHNYMDYSWDECLTEFTNGQIARAIAQIELYRGIII